MADNIDIAADLQEAANQAALKRQQAAAAAAAGPKPTGYCHNPLCCDDVDGDRLFCGSDCAAEYERLNRK